MPHSNNIRGMEANSIISKLNKYSVYAIIFLCLLPLIYLLLPQKFTSYFDAFDKLSIPLCAALYSYYWLKFSRLIKTTKREVDFLKKRGDALGKLGNITSFDEYKSNAEQLSNLEGDLINLEQHLEFINEALRVFVIAGAAIKVIQLFINV